MENIADATIASAQAAYPSGTRKAFMQASAPAGWALDETVMDRLLRVVSGAGGGVGGSWTVSGISAKETALGLGQIPLHTHAASVLSASHGHTSSMQEDGAHFHTGATDNAGGHSHLVSTSLAGSHQHSLYAYQYGSGSQWGNLALGSSVTTAPAGAHTHAATIGNAGAHSHGSIAMYGGEHSHSFTIAASGSHAHEIALESTGADQGHSHVVSSDGSWRPAYIDVILCRRL